MACDLVRFVDEIYLAYETMATKLKPSGRSHENLKSKFNDVIDGNVISLP